MKILLVSATALEISPFLSKLKRNELHFNSNPDFDILLSGIGLTATSYALTRQILIKKPDLVVQAGLAGGFDKQMKPGIVVTIKQDTIADESVVEMNSLKTLFDLELVPHNRFPFKKGWLVNPYKELIKEVKLKAVRGISVNEITTSKKTIRFYKEKFDPVVESMEGAAMHYVCLMQDIPFLQVRSISNRIGERNKGKWNMKESINNLNHELIRIFEKL